LIDERQLYVVSPWLVCEQEEDQLVVEKGTDAEKVMYASKKKQV
jgi:hypothetical protein